NDPHDRLDELANGDVAARTNIDVTFTRIMLQEKNERVGQIVNVQKFAPWCSRTPDLDLLGSAHFGCMSLGDEGRNNVRCCQIVMVTDAVEVGRHRRDKIAAMLSAVSATQHDPGDFRDRVPLIGGFERSGQQSIFGHWLRCEPWINARRAEEQKLPYP